jgi:predicted dehydrogenase
MTENGKRVRIGIIGAGGLCRSTHLPALQAAAAAEVVAICDEVPGRALELCDTFAVESAYENYHAMLSEVSMDAVYVLTQPDRLFRVVLDCLHAGYPVFMEKPPGITLFQAETLARESERLGLPVQVGFNRRYIPLVREALRILREHSNITHIDGRFYKHGEAAFYGGCATAFECDTIHCLDFIRFVAAAEPKNGALLEGCSDDVVPNVWQGIIGFENGVTGTVRAHYRTGGRVHELEIHGRGGSAYLNLGFGDDSCSAELLLFDGEGSFSLASKGTGKGRKLHLDGRKVAGSDEFYRYYGFYDQTKSFVESVASGRPPECDITEGVRTMRLIEFLRVRRIGS